MTEALASPVNQMEREIIRGVAPDGKVVRAVLQDREIWEEVWVPTKHVTGEVGPDGCWEQATDTQKLWLYRKVLVVAYENLKQNHPLYGTGEKGAL